jgi:hypothetical protein
MPNFSPKSLRKFEAIARSREGKSEWSRIEGPWCDLCDLRAVWEHPEGGRRCGSCIRPEKYRQPAKETP